MNPEETGGDPSDVVPNSSSSPSSVNNFPRSPVGNVRSAIRSPGNEHRSRTNQRARIDPRSVSQADHDTSHQYITAPHGDTYGGGAAGYNNGGGQYSNAHGGQYSDQLTGASSPFPQPESFTNPRRVSTNPRRAPTNPRLGNPVSPSRMRGDPPMRADEFSNGGEPLPMYKGDVDPVPYKVVQEMRDQLSKQETYPPNFNEKIFPAIGGFPSANSSVYPGVASLPVSPTANPMNPLSVTVPRQQLDETRAHLDRTRVHLAQNGFLDDTLGEQTVYDQTICDQTYVEPDALQSRVLPTSPGHHTNITVHSIRSDIFDTSDGEGLVDADDNDRTVSTSNAPPRSTGVSINGTRLPARSALAPPRNITAAPKATRNRGNGNKAAPLIGNKTGGNDIERVLNNAADGDLLGIPAKPIKYGKHRFPALPKFEKKSSWFGSKGPKRNPKKGLNPVNVENTLSSVGGAASESVYPMNDTATMKNVRFYSGDSQTSNSNRKGSVYLEYMTPGRLGMREKIASSAQHDVLIETVDETFEDHDVGTLVNSSVNGGNSTIADFSESANPNVNRQASINSLYKDIAMAKIDEEGCPVGSTSEIEGDSGKSGNPDALFGNVVAHGGYDYDSMCKLTASLGCKTKDWLPMSIEECVEMLEQWDNKTSTGASANRVCDKSFGCVTTPQGTPQKDKYQSTPLGKLLTMNNLIVTNSMTCGSPSLTCGDEGGVDVNLMKSNLGVDEDDGLSADEFVFHPLFVFGPGIDRILKILNVPLLRKGVIPDVWVNRKKGILLFMELDQITRNVGKKCTVIKKYKDIAKDSATKVEAQQKAKSVTYPILLSRQDRLEPVTKIYFDAFAGTLTEERVDMFKSYTTMADLFVLEDLPPLICGEKSGEPSLMAQKAISISDYVSNRCLEQKAGQKTRAVRIEELEGHFLKAFQKISVGYAKSSKNGGMCGMDGSKQYGLEGILDVIDTVRGIGTDIAKLKEAVSNPSSQHSSPDFESPTLTESDVSDVQVQLLDSVEDLETTLIKVKNGVDNRNTTLNMTLKEHHSFESAILEDTFKHALNKYVEMTKNSLRDKRHHVLRCFPQGTSVLNSDQTGYINSMNSEQPVVRRRPDNTVLNTNAAEIRNRAIMVDPVTVDMSRVVDTTTTGEEQPATPDQVVHRMYSSLTSGQKYSNALEVLDKNLRQSMMTPASNPYVVSSAEKERVSLGKQREWENAGPPAGRDSHESQKIDSCISSIPPMNSVHNSIQNSEARFSDAMMSDVRFGSARNSEARNSEARMSDTNMSEARGSEMKYSEARGSEIKSEARFSEARFSEGRNSEAKFLDGGRSTNGSVREFGPSAAYTHAMEKTGSKEWKHRDRQGSTASRSSHPGSEVSHDLDSHSVFLEFSERETIISGQSRHSKQFVQANAGRLDNNRDTVNAQNSVMKAQNAVCPRLSDMNLGSQLTLAPNAIVPSDATMNATVTTLIEGKDAFGNPVRRDSIGSVGSVDTIVNSDEGIPHQGLGRRGSETLSIASIASVTSDMNRSGYDSTKSANKSVKKSPKKNARQNRMRRAQTIPIADDEKLDPHGLARFKTVGGKPIYQKVMMSKRGQLLFVTSTRDRVLRQNHNQMPLLKRSRTENLIQVKRDSERELDSNSNSASNEASSNSGSGETQQTSSDSGSAASQTGQNPGQNGQNPGQNGQNPGQNGQKLGQSVQKLGQNGQNPNGGFNQNSFNVETDSCTSRNLSRASSKETVESGLQTHPWNSEKPFGQNCIGMANASRGNSPKNLLGRNSKGGILLNRERSSSHSSTGSGPKFITFGDEERPVADGVGDTGGSPMNIQGSGGGIPIPKGSNSGEKKKKGRFSGLRNAVARLKGKKNTEPSDDSAIKSAEKDTCTAGKTTDSTAKSAAASAGTGGGKVKKDSSEKNQKKFSSLVAEVLQDKPETVKIKNNEVRIKNIEGKHNKAAMSRENTRENTDALPFTAFMNTNPVSEHKNNTLGTSDSIKGTALARDTKNGFINPTSGSRKNPFLDAAKGSGTSVASGSSASNSVDNSKPNFRGKIQSIFARKPVAMVIQDSSFDETSKEETEDWSKTEVVDPLSMPVDLSSLKTIAEVEERVSSGKKSGIDDSHDERAKKPEDAKNTNSGYNENSIDDSMSVSSHPAKKTGIVGKLANKLTPFKKNDNSNTSVSVTDSVAGGGSVRKEGKKLLKQTLNTSLESPAVPAIDSAFNIDAMNRILSESSVKKKSKPSAHKPSKTKDRVDKAIDISEIVPVEELDIAPPTTGKEVIRKEDRIDDLLAKSLERPPLLGRDFLPTPTPVRHLTYSFNDVDELLAEQMQNAQNVKDNQDSISYVSEHRLPEDELSLIDDVMPTPSKEEPTPVDGNQNDPLLKPDTVPDVAAKHPDGSVVVKQLADVAVEQLDAAVVVKQPSDDKKKSDEKKRKKSIGERKEKKEERSRSSKSDRDSSKDIDKEKKHKDKRDKRLDKDKKHKSKKVEELHRDDFSIASDSDDPSLIGDLCGEPHEIDPDSMENNASHRKRKKSKKRPETPCSLTETVYTDDKTETEILPKLKIHTDDNLDQPHHATSSSGHNNSGSGHNGSSGSSSSQEYTELDGSVADEMYSTRPDPRVHYPVETDSLSITTERPTADSLRPTKTNPKNHMVGLNRLLSDTSPNEDITDVPKIGEILEELDRPWWQWW